MARGRRARRARGGAPFIERDRLRALPGTVDRIAGALRAGAAVTVFPRAAPGAGAPTAASAGPSSRPRSTRACPSSRSACATGGGTAGPGTAAAFVGEDTLLASLRRVARARDLVAEVEIRPVIPPGTHPDRRALARASQSPRPGARLDDAALVTAGGRAPGAP